MVGDTAAEHMSTLPLTERILRRLGRPRWLWIVLWSLVPMLSPFLFATAARVGGSPLATEAFVDLVATQAGLTFATFVLLVGAGVLARKAVAIGTDVGGLVPGGLPAGLFHGIGSVPGPLALTAVVVAITSAGGWLTYGPLPPLAAMPVLFFYLIPILTFVWVYLVILVELDRLGRRPLALDRFPEDRALGMDDLGSLASTGLGLLLVAVAPVLVAGSDEPVTLGISLAIVVVGVGIFVLSMWRLHRQMVSAKRRYLALAQQLYADAYEPLRGSPDTQTLEAQSTALRAAQSLDERAESILTWPVDEGALRFIVVVITSVLTSVIVRALFAAVGF